MVERRAHPTVRPHALALGVVASAPLAGRALPGLPAPLSSAGAGAALARALLTDALATLMTFPVRYRFAFGPTPHGGAKALSAHVSEAWKCEDLRGATTAEAYASALDLLLSTGAESALLVRGDVAGLPLGDLFDAMMWLLPRQRLAVGLAERGGLYAIGAAERLDALVGVAVDGDLTALRSRAKADGVTLKKLPRAYEVDSEAALRRLARDAAAGAHLASTRQLFQGAEFAAYATESIG